MIKIICVVLLFVFTYDAASGSGADFNSGSLFYELIDADKTDDNNKEPIDDDAFVNQQVEKQTLSFKKCIQINSHSFLLSFIRNSLQCVRAPPY